MHPLAVAVFCATLVAALIACVLTIHRQRNQIQSFERNARSMAGELAARAHRLSYQTTLIAKLEDGCKRYSDELKRVDIIRARTEMSLIHEKAEVARLTALR